MKNRILYFLLLVIIASCTNLNHGNFNKRKYLNLKLKTTYTAVPSEKIESNTNNVGTKSIDANSTEDFVANTDSKNIENFAPIEIVETTILAEKSSKKIIQKDKSNLAKGKNGTESNASSEFGRHAVKDIIKQAHQKGKSGLYYFSVLLIIPFALKSKKGHQISKWALKNDKKARSLITALAITGAGSSYALGNLLSLNIDSSMIAAPVVLGGIALGLYKLKVSPFKKYIKDRLSFLLLNISIFFGSFAAGSTASHSILNVFSNNPDVTVLDSGLATGLIALFIFLSIIAILGVAVLACHIFCVYSTALAVIVLFFGSVIVIFAAILGITAINKRVAGVKTEKQSANKIAIISGYIIQTLIIGLGIMDMVLWW